MKSKWISDDHWICTNHVPAPRLPSVQKTCYYCGSPRPDDQRMKKPFKPILLPGATKPTAAAVKIAKAQTVLAASVAICGWPGCGKTASPKSKYCSRKCSNKNASARSIARKHRAKSAPPPSGERVIPSLIPPPPNLPATLLQPPEPPNFPTQVEENFPVHKEENFPAYKEENFLRTPAEFLAFDEQIFPPAKVSS